MLNKHMRENKDTYLNKAASKPMNCYDERIEFVQNIIDSEIVIHQPEKKYHWIQKSCYTAKPMGKE
ncbi:18097_t:CDS:1 [Gigaspora rosea]|nr:18097_t:CDS:1 [Gigaspora rosea]